MQDVDGTWTTIASRQPLSTTSATTAANTDPRTNVDVATETRARLQVAVQTETSKVDLTSNFLIDEKKLKMLEDMMEESQKGSPLNALEKLHRDSLVRLHVISRVSLPQVKAEGTPSRDERWLSLRAGSAGRSVLLFGVNSHVSWCSHVGKVLVAQRSKASLVSLSVCPTAAEWSPQGSLAVSTVAGELLLLGADSVQSSTTLHQLAITSFTWIDSRTLLTLSIDGRVLLSILKGIELHAGKSFDLTVEDLPRSIRQSKTSKKSVALVSLSKCNSQLCFASETGGLWLGELATDGSFTRRPVSVEAQPVEKVFLISSHIALVSCRGKSSEVTLTRIGVQIYKEDGEWEDEVLGSLQASTASQAFLFLAFASKLLVYDVTKRSILCTENIDATIMDVNPEGDLVLLNNNCELVTYKVTRL